MRERLIEPIVIEHVWLAGHNPTAFVLTHYDEDTGDYSSVTDGIVSGEYLELIRRGEFSWLRVRS